MGPIPPGGNLWGDPPPPVVEEWNQGYAPQMQDCEAFNEPLIWEDSEGNSQYIACPSTGIFYAPPLGLAALSELLWPESWSLLPPG